MIMTVILCIYPSHGLEFFHVHMTIKAISYVVWKQYNEYIHELRKEDELMVRELLNMNGFTSGNWELVYHIIPQSTMP